MSNLMGDWHATGVCNLMLELDYRSKHCWTNFIVENMIHKLFGHYKTREECNSRIITDANIFQVK